MWKRGDGSRSNNDYNAHEIFVHCSGNILPSRRKHLTPVKIKHNHPPFIVLILTDRWIGKTARLLPLCHPSRCRSLCRHGRNGSDRARSTAPPAFDARNSNFHTWKITRSRSLSHVRNHELVVNGIIFNRF